MTIRNFAELNRLRYRLDDCGERIIPGRLGQIYDNGDGRMGVMVSFEGIRGATAKRWGNVRRAFEACGFVIRQNAELEGSAVFEAGNREQVKLAIRCAGVKHRKRMSPDALAHLSRIRRTSVRKAAARLESIGGHQVV